MRLTQFFKCLADDTRLHCLLLLLDENELCVCELHESLAVSQPTVSRHLTELRQCGLVLDERRGRWMFYRLHPDLPAWAMAVLRETKNGNQHYLTATQRRLEQRRVCEANP